MSQDDTTVFSKPPQRHQVGLNMGEFIPIFRSQDTNYKLNYRYLLSYKYAIRSSAEYNQESGDNGRFQLGFRLGVDRTIKNIKKFSIYTGLDFNTQIELNDADKRENYWFGPSAFIGFKYQVAQFLSFTTEPGLYVNRRIFKDPLSFDTQISKWTELKIGNIGHLQMSFHF